MTEAGRKVAYALVGVAVLAGLILLAARFLRDDDEERPPIIVRGGSVIFELQAMMNESASREWTDDGTGNNWTPDQPNGHNTTKLVVTIDTQDAECQRLEGPTVHVMRTPNNTPPLHVLAAGGTPRVGPKNQLREDNSTQLKTLSYMAGDLVAIRVGNRECPVTNSNEISIQPSR